MTRMLLTALALCALWPAASHAQELGGEVSVELGRLHNGDEAFDLFSDIDGLPSRGIRAGVSYDRFTVLAGWHRARRGSTVDLPNGDQIVAAFFADEFTLGPKAHLEIGEVFYPYASVQGMIFRGVMKFDDDSGTDKNPGQVRQSGVSPGALFLGGVEFRSKISRSSPVSVALYFEAGYGLVGRASFDEYGTMKPGGLAWRTGVGARF